jgi:SAM-dependent methyltransferase
VTLLAETAEKKHCSQCGSDSALFMTAKDYNKKISNEIFSYYKCDNCSFVFLDPIPSDLGRYYQEDYYELPTSAEDLLERSERLQQWKIDTVLQFKKTGKLLEIGPAYGLFAFLAKRAGFQVSAIEMDSRCCDYLRDVIGIDVVESSDTLKALKALPKFDVIVLWQVLEHLPEPWPILDALAERLAPDGIIVLDVPNPNSFQFGILGHRWVHLDPPRHVTLISSELLRERIESRGLTTDLITSANEGANGYNGFGWAFSLKNFFRSNLVRKAADFIGRVISKLLIPVERTGNRGSTYTAVFRKAAS